MSHFGEIDLNADLGEEITDDDGLLQVVTSANLACGYHAGNPEIMRRVCAQAARSDVRIGAQVSYLDREHFGRRPLDLRPAVLRQQVAEQWALLTGIAAQEGGQVSYLKPHGALYNRVVTDPEQAQAVLDAVPDVEVLGLPGGEFLRLAAAQGRTVVTEGFPDRRYTPAGGLAPRSEPDAVLHDAALIARRAVTLASGTADDDLPAVPVRSICVHGDSPGAVQTAHAVRQALVRAGWRLAPFSSRGV